LVSPISNIKAGLGLGALPTMIGDIEPELVRCLPPPPELRAEMYLVVREDLRRQPHVRAFVDFLVEFIRATMAEKQASAATSTGAWSVEPQRPEEPEIR